MIKQSEKHISKQEIIGKRFIVRSMISDASILNFRDNRVCLRNYDTWRMHSFLGTENNLRMLKQMLFVRENIPDNDITAWDIEEFRWGHYVKKSFIEDVGRILSSIDYNEDFEDIVILLLTYKYFIEFTYMDVDDSSDYGDLDLIDWALNFSPENFPASPLVVYPSTRKTEFTKDASCFVHALILKYSETDVFSEYIAMRKKMKSEYLEVKHLVKTLQGTDRGNTVKLWRRKVVRILFLSFRYCQVMKQEKLFAVGELISLVDGYKEAFVADKHNSLMDFYTNRLRSCVSDLNKMQFAAD